MPLFTGINVKIRNRSAYVIVSLYNWSIPALSYIAYRVGTQTRSKATDQED